jgi:undecaprenyl-diphosphatase
MLLRASWPAIAYLGMLVCNIIMRTVIARLPPQVDTIPNLLPEIQTDFQRFSFPSGHAGSIVVAYLSLAIITRRVQAIRWLTLIAAIILIFGVGFGRVYLGVHWPSDVAAGLLLGIVWLAIAYGIGHRQDQNWSRERHSNIEQ